MLFMVPPEIRIYVYIFMCLPKLAYTLIKINAYKNMSFLCVFVFASLPAETQCANDMHEIKEMLKSLLQIKYRW